MKVELIVGIMLVCCCFVNADEEEPKLQYYRQGNNRAWNFGGILLERVSGNEKEKIEAELAASAFSYWYLLQKGLIEKNVALENHIKKFFDDDTRRMKYAKDPLEGLKRAVSLKIRIREHDYPKLVNGFMEFIQKL